MLRRLTQISLATSLAVSLALVGCSDGDVPDERLVATYADVILIRESMNDTLLVQHKVDSVLTAHSYVREDFEKDLRSMGTNPKLFKSFYDSVSVKLSLMRDTTSP
ncbi:MAG: hypothetical protein H7X70_06535 [Candidatus Kapabacteria bacterium]|nr:hypothetical protein [Candidatus Kapabacteria bacterium]